MDMRKERKRILPLPRTMTAFMSEWQFPQSSKSQHLIPEKRRLLNQHSFYIRVELRCIFCNLEGEMFSPHDMIRLISQTGTGSSAEAGSAWMMDPMVLHFGNREYILFGFWKTGTFLGLAASILIVVLLSILYEAVKALRLYFARNRAVERLNQRIQSNIVVRESSEHIDSVSTESMPYSPILGFSGFRAVKQLFTFYRIVQSSLYFAQMLLAYTLMLIAMTFNVWLILSIIFGKAIGYFLFSEEPVPGENNDTCC